MGELSVVGGISEMGGMRGLNGLGKHIWLPVVGWNVGCVTLIFIRSGWGVGGVGGGA